MLFIGIVLLFLFLAILGAPLFVVIGGIALSGFLIDFGFDIKGTITVIQELYIIAENPMFVTIPLFTFAGYLMAESKTSVRLVNVAKSFFGWLPGGLAMVTLLTCSFFTVFTGVSGVTIIALGGLLFPVLLKEGYPEKFSLGLITTGGSCGLTFPPSLPLILFGVIASMSLQSASQSLDASVSIDKLFVAGIIPGVLVIVALGIYSMIIGARAGVKRTKFSISEALISLKNAFWELPIPVIILGGIYGGLITASEAAVVVAFYVFIVEVFIYKDLHLTKDIPNIIKESMLLVGGIFIIIGAALGLTNYLIDQQVPMTLLALMKKYISSQTTFLILLNVFLLLVGALLDIFSAILVVVPLIVPIALEYGVSPIHLGIIFLINLEIGYSTPPVGLNLFIASFRFDKPILQLYGASMIYIGILLVVLMLITYIPSLTLSLLEPDKTQAMVIIGVIMAVFTFFAFISLIIEKKANRA